MSDSTQMTDEQIREAEHFLRQRLRSLFWKRDIDPNGQAIDDVCQECLMTIWANDCLTERFICTVAKISVARMVERQARKRERSYDIKTDDGTEWGRNIPANSSEYREDNVDVLIATIENDSLRRTAEAIVTNRTFADARRALGVTKTTIQRHRAQLREVLAGGVS